jgi:MFS family permease
LTAPDPPPAVAATPPLRNPWWIPPFLGRVPSGVEPRHLSLLGAVAFALLFEEYDLAMLTQALNFIARDLGIAEQDLGFYLGIVRLGGVPAVLLIPQADRVGRRRMFLFSLAGSALATCATGFAWNAASFVAFQMLVRTFFVAGSAMAYVLITEEYPAARRGWGMGVLAALGATGYGLAAGMFSAIETLPYGWRFLYWVGITPLIFLPLFRRIIPESARFEARRASRPAETGGLFERTFGPFRRLVVGSGWRFFGITLCMGAMGFAGVAAFQFTGYYTQEVLGYAPWQFGAMFVGGGLIGILGNVYAGRQGDRVGRRVVGAVCMFVSPAFVAAFYWGPAWIVPLAWIGFVFTSSGGRMIIRAFSTELFDTDRRGTATGWTMLIEAISAAGGLLVLDLLSTQPGDLERTIPLLALVTWVIAVVLLCFPETRSRELEEI